MTLRLQARAHDAVGNEDQEAVQSVRADALWSVGDQRKLAIEQPGRGNGDRVDAVAEAVGVEIGLQEAGQFASATARVKRL